MSARCSCFRNGAMPVIDELLRRKYLLRGHNIVVPCSEQNNWTVQLGEIDPPAPRSSCMQEIAIRQPYDCESQRATSTQTVDKIFLPMNRPRCPHGAIAFVMVQCP